MVDEAEESESRSRARGRRLRAAVASSVVSKAGSVAYQIVAVPLIVASVGSAGYSQFAVVLAAFGWFGSLFAGLGAAVTERVAIEGQRPISAGARGTFMTAVSVSGALFAALVIGGLIVLASRPPGEPDHMALVVAGVATGLTLSGGVFDAALLGIQRSAVTNLLSFASSLLAVAATIGAAVMAPTVSAMVLATLGPVVLARAGSAFILHRIEPGLWGRIRDIAWRAAPRIAGRGVVFAGISFASFLSLDAGLLIVAENLGSTRVAEVALVMRILPLVLSIVGMIMVPLWPAITEAATGGDLHWVAKTGVRTTALVMGYAVAAAVAIVVAGNPVVRLWTGGRISIPFDVLLATAGLVVTLSWEGLSQTWLLGLGRAGTVASVLLAQGIVSIIAVVVLVPSIGQTAALVGPLVSALLMGSWLLPVLAVRGFRARSLAHANGNHTGRSAR